MGSRMGQLAALRNGKHPLTGVKLGATSALQQHANVVKFENRGNAIRQAVGKLQVLQDQRVAWAVGKLLSGVAR